MSFYEFMLSDYQNDATAEGNLAGDMLDEQAACPRCGTDGYEVIRQHLLAHHACPVCMRAFEKR